MITQFLTMTTRFFRLVLLVLLAVVLAFSQRVEVTAGVAGQNLIGRTYLGFASANTAKTATLSVNALVGFSHIAVIACSGNFATSNWTGTVTDSAGNTYSQIGAQSGTYPQANSTTQVCIPYVAVAGAQKSSSTPLVSSITFTIAGSSSANTTVALMAWGISGAVPSLAAVDHWSYGTSSGATALATYPVTSSQPNALAIAGGCASTGTITQPANSGLTFDTTSKAIASGSNIATCFGGSAILGQPAGVTGSFTDGSSAAFSEVTLLFIGYALTEGGIQHAQGNNTFLTTTTTTFASSPMFVSQPPSWMRANNPGSGSTASLAWPGATGMVKVLTGFGYCLVGDSTGAASSQAVTLVTNGVTLYNANVSIPTGASAVGSCYSSPPLAIADSGYQGFTLAFGGNVAHALESVWMTGYTVDQTGIVF